MENKLQQGDYVTDLTEEQFNDLINIENHSYKLPFKWTGLRFDGIDLMYETGSVSSKTKLTFEEFRERAINTFQS